MDVLAARRAAPQLVTWNDTAAEFPHDRTVHELVAGASTRTARALVFGAERVSYGELDAARQPPGPRTGRPAACGPGVTVGVLLDRGLDLVVAVLAVLKAGGAYTVLDPQFPDERLAAVVAPGRGAACGHRRRAVRPRCPGCGSDRARPGHDRPQPAVASGSTPGDAACVMFTSGSTGRPKGVVASHRAMVGTLTSQSYVDFAADEVWLQCSPVSWDAFALELFGRAAVRRRRACCSRDRPRSRR